MKKSKLKRSKTFLRNDGLISQKVGVDEDQHRKTESTIPSQDIIRRFTYLNSESIYNTLETLANSYPNLATLENSQEKYGLHAAGNIDDCKFDHELDENMDAGCLNWFLTIEDKLSHPEGSASSKHLPEVFLSGALHGNERIGPTTVVETAALLLDAANCEAYPRGKAPTKRSSHLQWSQWEEELESAKACRDELSAKGISPFYRKWLARLVTTRRIVILPAANSLGYFRDQREEGRVDPNRDFPFDLNDSQCMVTIAGRTINEIFREHLFQLSLTFHAGMSAIGYEWGAPTYGIITKSPDDIAQHEIAQGYSNYAGKLPSTIQEVQAYPYGTMNDIVYPVRGGMEDWAYGASWDTERTTPCHPESFGGYPTEKTTYNNATLRMFNMLVETSKKKTPSENHLGTTFDLFNSQRVDGMGHVSRNIRLSLLMIDVVEPYVHFTAVHDHLLQDDIVPFTDRTGRNCKLTKVIKIDKNSFQEKGPILEWTVGGGFEVSETGLIYAKWENMPTEFDGAVQPSPEMIETFSTMSRITIEEEGRTRWNKKGAFPTESQNDMKDRQGPIFSTSLNLKDFKPGDEIAVLAYSMLDQTWRNEVDSFAPKLPPQSHLVNARTNPDWVFESAGKIIQGRDWWFSTPVTIKIVEGLFESNEEGIGDESLTSIAVALRFPKNFDSHEDLSLDKDDYAVQLHPLMVFMFSGAATVAGLVALFFWKRTRGMKMPSSISFEKLELDSNRSKHSKVDADDGYEDGSLEMTDNFSIS